MEKKLTTNDVSQNLKKLNELTNIKWNIVDAKLCKVFEFSSFVDAFGFMSKVALVAERMNHHPEWTNIFKKVEIKLDTHNSGGITNLDFILAQEMEMFLK